MQILVCMKQTVGEVNSLDNKHFPHLLVKTSVISSRMHSDAPITNNGSEMFRVERAFSISGADHLCDAFRHAEWRAIRVFRKERESRNRIISLTFGLY